MGTNKQGNIWKTWYIILQSAVEWQYLWELLKYNPQIAITERGKLMTSKIITAHYLLKNRKPTF